MQILRCISSVIFLAAFSLISGEVTIRRHEKLSEELEVSWEVDFDTENVTFTVTASTKGFIGFGFSANGGMENADVVIGGVDDAGKPYFADRWATGKMEPEVDASQDWFLISASENVTHTMLKFYRSIDTCDDQDLPIPIDTTNFIWSIGENDSIEYHKNRGSSAVNMLDKPSPPVNVDGFDKWEIKVNTTIPTRDTSYWCTFHQSKYSDGIKRHIVGFEVMLEEFLAIKYNHHLILHKCLKNPQDDLELDPRGGECFDDYDDGTNGNMSLAMEHCSTLMYVWARGGKPLFLPENVGILMSGKPDEYFVMEIHYDNPNTDAGVSYDTGLRVFTTQDLRNESAGVLTVGNGVDYQMVIPKESENFVSVGHCASQCTSSKFPPEGINIFNVLLHSHLAGRKLKLRLFRNGTELPWISYDRNYDFNYQQNRPLLSELKLLPGDHLTYECTYTTTWRNPASVTLGGLSTRHEMCEAFLMYYPILPSLDVCESQVPLDGLMKRFGIEELNPLFRNGVGGDPIVSKPANMSGKLYTDVIDSMVNWTTEFREEFQHFVRFDPHYMSCFSHANVTEEEGVSVTYPKTQEDYAPPERKCDGENLPSSTTDGAEKLPSSTDGAEKLSSTTESGAVSQFLISLPLFGLTLISLYWT